MKIINSKIAAAKMRRVMRLDIEEFWCMGLNSQKQILQMECLFRGTVDACMVHPRDIFRFVCLTNSSSFIVAHNHPSGDPTPSLTDIRLTHQLLKASQIMQIPLTDHLVITEAHHTSFAEQRWFKKCNKALPKKRS